MKSEKTKTIILIIGVILACLLLIQGFSLGSGSVLNIGQIEVSSIVFPDLIEVKKVSFNLF